MDFIYIRYVTFSRYNKNEKNILLFTYSFFIIKKIKMWLKDKICLKSLYVHGVILIITKHPHDIWT